MQFNIENLSSIKKVLHVEIPVDKVNQEIEKLYKEINKTANIKGFRQGKAPKSLLERLYGKNVSVDVAHNLIEESIKKIISQEQLKIVGTPQTKFLPVESNSSYKYDATIEVMPKLDIIDFKNLELKKNIYNIDRDTNLIDVQLKALQKKLADHEKIEEDRPCQDGDFVIIDFEAFKDGKLFEKVGKSEDFVGKIGPREEEGFFLSEQIKGMKIGENKEVNFCYPNDFQDKELAGIEVDFKILLKEIKKEVFPEINDDFAKRFGQENLEDLKEKIKTDLKERYDRHSEKDLNEQILNNLSQRVKDFEVPETMIENELEEMVKDAEVMLNNYNTSLEQINMSKNELKEKYREAAIKNVKRFIIINEIIEQEKLELSKEEIETSFETVSQYSNQSVEKIKAYYYQDVSKLSEFTYAILQKKVFDLIIANSKIEEINLSNQDKNIKIDITNEE